MTPLSSILLTVLIRMSKLPMTIDAALGCYRRYILNFMSCNKIIIVDNSNVVCSQVNPLSLGDILLG